MTSYRAGEAGGFAFTEVNAKRAVAAIAHYPEGRQASAVMALLDLAQRQNDGWLSSEAIEYVANTLEMAPIRVHEVASFYTMYNTKPVGKHLVQVCRTTPCWLRGAAGLTDTCRDKLGIGLGETTEDGRFTLVEVECLGACANAPVVQIGDDYYEDLSPERLNALLDDLKAGKEIAAGSQTGRRSSMPEGGATTLTELPARAPAKPGRAVPAPESPGGEGA
ncbi:MAG: NADH-quinone oxidoreductase subunit NuoE [Proteobacteria bacterium]|nr:NADH-quinone oxidoreductase subunit NuoE [Pseudomonadota bacterium]